MANDVANQVDSTSTETTDVEKENAVNSLQNALAEVLEDAKFPDANTVVTGRLSPEKVTKIAEAGIEHIVNLQPESELSFDEKAAH